jgi:glutamyl-Q tRNA(Asp) synthetase
MAFAGYVGRFAPSPTGPLHAGSLLSAAASYLQARQNGGLWYLRIEDIDPPREIPGAADDILRTLERFGFAWDGPVRYQSQHIELYRERLSLIADHCFRCSCSRREITRVAREMGITDGRYPGTCRGGSGAANGALRIRFDRPQAFSDLIQGEIPAGAGPDDFMLWRKDDLPAYQWAVTVDDVEQGITEVVRGCDLLHTTPRQIFLLQQLGAPVPRFAHVPIVLNDAGHKLSKQTGAVGLARGHEKAQLCATFKALALPVEHAPIDDSLAGLWLWAIRQWQPKRLKDKKTIPFVNPV